jgi:hypothetical protein
MGKRACSNIRGSRPGTPLQISAECLKANGSLVTLDKSVKLKHLTRTNSNGPTHGGLIACGAKLPTCCSPVHMTGPTHGGLIACGAKLPTCCRPVLLMHAGSTQRTLLETFMPGQLSTKAGTSIIKFANTHTVHGPTWDRHCLHHHPRSLCTFSHSYIERLVSITPVHCALLVTATSGMHGNVPNLVRHAR